MGTQPQEEYNLRDIGPAGGLIFYINPNYATDGWKYLEAAPSASDTVTVRWSGITTLIGTTEAGLGTGLDNTNEIIAQSGFTTGSAKNCKNLNINTYVDWYLPSKDELNLMYQELHLYSVGNFYAGSYWSSTEVSATNAYRQTFNGGASSSQGKTTTYRFRGIRRFLTVVTGRLIYNGNGNTTGTVPSPSAYYDKGSSITTASSGGLAHNTDSFVGWNTQSDGYGIDYIAGESVTITDGNITLYAKYSSTIIAFLPDTQSYVKYKQTVMTSQLNWLSTNINNDPLIKFVGHVGDLIQDHDTDTSQWSFVQTEMAKLTTSNIPFAIVPGNHDYKEATRDSTMMNSYFPLSNFSSMSTYGGSYDTNCDNTYHIINIHGVSWLIMCLEMGVRSSVLTWANGIISTNSTMPTIVMTHSYLNGQPPNTGNLLTHPDNHAASNGYGLGNGPPDVNDGDDIWTNLIYPNNNIRLVICGHDGTATVGSAIRTSQHADNSYVHQILSDYQYYASYPGYIILLKFNSTTINFRSYSPYLGTYNTDVGSYGEWTI